MMAPPAALAPLVAAHRWINWRWVERADGGKPDKVPFNPHRPDRHASTQDPRTWGPFPLCRGLVIEKRADGPGYVLRDDPDHIFFDLDNCRDPATGELASWAVRLVEAANSYTELTPSGRGLRIIGRNETFAVSIHRTVRMPDGGKVEIFHRCARYVTMSFNRLPGTPDRLAPICDLAAELLMLAGQGAAPEDIRPGRDATASIEDIRSALAAIPNDDLPWEQWSRIGMAAWRASGGAEDALAAWKAWSAKSRKHNDAACDERWRHWFRSPPSRLGFGSLHFLASHASPLWVPPSRRAPDPGPFSGALAAPGASAEPWDAPGPEKPSAPARTAQAPALWIDGDRPDEVFIPARPWVVPGYLMRGAVSVLSGSGGGGKSSLVVAWTTALAEGRALGGFAPRQPEIVVNYNVEDDRDEQRRRYAAALVAQRASGETIQRRVFRCGPMGVGTLFERDPMTGRVTPTIALEALRALIEESGASVLVADPLAELHNAEENDNTAMRAVIAAFRAMARDLDIAVLVLHHNRKGTQEAGSADMIRGAGAITGAVRVALTLSTMTPEEADKLGVKPEDRRAHFRVDGAKSNYAPPAEAEWWRLKAVEIHNGEQIAAVVPWAPPSAFGTLSMADCVAILEAIRAKTGTNHRGEPTGFKESQKAGPMNATSVLERFGVSHERARDLLAAWVRMGTLALVEGRDFKREPAMIYRVNDAALAEMRLSAGATQAPDFSDDEP
jgi:hypothetical protein